MVFIYGAPLPEKRVFFKIFRTLYSIYYSISILVSNYYYPFISTKKLQKEVKLILARDARIEKNTQTNGS
jgi:hypothetical protein